MGVNEIIQIGNTIRELRNKKGYTQKQMSELTGIPYSTYSNYENNNREPNKEQLQKIATALDVPLYKLMGFDGSIRVNTNPERERLDEEAVEIFKRQASGEEITEEESQKVSDYIKHTQGDYDKLIKSMKNLAKVIGKFLNENTQISKEDVQLLKEKLQMLTDRIPDIPDFYESLNDIGRQKASDYISDLSNMPKYQKKPDESPEE